MGLARIGHHICSAGVWGRLHRRDGVTGAHVGGGEGVEPVLANVAGPRGRSLWARVDARGRNCSCLEVGSPSGCARARQTGATPGQSVAARRPRVCERFSGRGTPGIGRGERDSDPARRHADRAYDLEQLAADGPRLSPLQLGARSARTGGPSRCACVAARVLLPLKVTESDHASDMPTASGPASPC